MLKFYDLKFYFIGSRTFSSSSSKESTGNAGPPSEAGAAMNRENVSNKIAAGMDRWQNTLEDMINLRSSNNQVFKDNYWVSAKYTFI